MGMFLKQQDNQRSQLQEKIAAQLKERTQVAKDIQLDKPDPAFMDNQHKTRPVGVILAIAVLAAILITAWVVST